MTWADEMSAMLREAKGRVDLFLALVALRRVENGGPGKEFGVLSVDAPGYSQQLRVAANSFTRAEERLRTLLQVRATETGLYTDEFLQSFSNRWAPLTAENDPSGLNANHARNLITIYHQLSSQVLGSMLGLAQA